MTRRFYSIRELISLTGLSKPTILNLIHHPDPARRLKAIRAGIRVLVRVEDFEDWMDRNQVDGKASVRNTRGRRKVRA